MVDDLAQRARRLLRPGGRTITGITGCPGAGKSTLAERLVQELNATSVPTAYVPMDGFHLADETLIRLGRRHRKGAIDTFDSYGYLAMLRRLHHERVTTIYAPGFERTLEQPIAAAIAMDPSVEVIVTEGNYLLATDDPWPQVRCEMAEVWYCDLDARARRERLVTRHVRFGKSEDEARRWVDTIDEPNARLIELTRDRADLVIDMHVTGQAG
jgi:pantothenate kinase